MDLPTAARAIEREIPTVFIFDFIKLYSAV